ncbi:HNH endonuclease family protein [Isoptericola halotolerans]|uniref:HNH endonuclease family protein n=1 Tax=Isoptericola halotolerans TaxID=300560 RepID=UPI00388EF0B4
MSRPSSRTSTRARRRVPLLVLALAVLLTAGVVTVGDLARGTGGPFAALVGGTDTATGAPGSALAAVDDLTVKGRAPKTGYDRDEFGPAWADVDRNGCDTRNDVLARDLTSVTFEPGTRECVVLTGSLVDPYTGSAIDFRRGRTTSTAVQIDHVVALSDAWQKGAQGLDAEERRQLANDPLNLLAVDGPTNGAKGDGDTATWLPPSTDYRCGYVARQVAVKIRYELWVTEAERDAMQRVLTTCPDEPLPAGSPS